MKRAIPPLIRAGTLVVCLGIVTLISQAYRPGGDSRVYPPQTDPLDPGLRTMARIESAELGKVSREFEAAGRRALDACEVALVRTTVSLVRACEAVKSLLPNPPEDHPPGDKPSRPGAPNNLLRSTPLS
jgi:hypothetical protein